MNCQGKDGRHRVLQRDGVDLDDVVRSISEQFRIVQGDPGRTAECCRELERCLSEPLSPPDIGRLQSLLPLLREHSGPLALPLFELLEHAASSCPDPWPLLCGMIAARDKPLALRALDLALRRTDGGSLVAGREIVGSLARVADVPGTCLTDPECLSRIGDLIRGAGVPGRERPADRVQALYLEDPEERVRRLAARILDMSGEPVSMELAETALGHEAFAFLEPYLIYTRATHADILSLLPSPGAPPPSMPSLRAAHSILGRNLLRQVIGGAGWPKLNLGIQVRHFVHLTPGDSLPIMLFPAEAALAAQCGKFRKPTEVFLLILEGGTPAERSDTEGAGDPAARFRSYNLAHAEVLGDFLAVAPLTRERVGNILERMDAIVAEFTALFSSLNDECAILPGIYGEIRNNIVAELEKYDNKGILPAELTRLTVSFEDPRTPGEIRTLHGLKRYLHQKGLQLGFRLVQRARSTNRTVTLLLTSRTRILRKVEEIRYTDFEPDDAAIPPGRMPYPVALAAEGFARQLLYGHMNFPRADIFCYGNEAHYFLSFGSHPAFLRINYAPPLQGGMIDLEYYGVSKYDLASHPDFNLDALQRFFRSLGFFIEVENTRVHARYDKEHTADLGILCEKAEAIFCIAPYLLDIDWTVGGLDLDADARRKVAQAWADAFACWGVLPLRYLLTKDRRGVIESIDRRPPGKREIVWSGSGPYPLRFRNEAGEFVAKFYAMAERLVPEVGRIRHEDARDRTGQFSLERSLLTPLRGAAERGELVETPKGYERTPPELFGRVPGPERFAELLAEGGPRLESAAALAWLVCPLERFLNFHTVGSVGGFDVQSARLTLQGGELGIHVLRCEAGLAFYTRGPVIYRRRDTPSGPWRSNALFDIPGFLATLRRANYPAPGPEQVPQHPGERAGRIRATLAEAAPPEPRRPIPGERTLDGLRASPGPAVGRVLFGTRGRSPGDFAGAVLVTPALQPGDGPFLHRAEGVVSTGGGILSHAALLAAQFHKPAIIVAGRWEEGPGGEQRLRSVSTEFSLEEGTSHGYHVCSRKEVRECEHLLREGDLVALDAHEDVLRVLGQEGDTLSLHEGFRHYGAASRDLAGAASDREVLIYRGRRIRARQQIEKVLARLTDPALTCHAVQELLLDSGGMARDAAADEKARLMNLILGNPRVAGTALSHMRWIVRELVCRFEKALRNAGKRIPDSRSIYEILSLRLEALQTGRSMEEVGACLEQCGHEGIMVDPARAADIETLARGRISGIREEIAATLRSIGQPSADARTRHLLRQWERSARLAGAPDQEKEQVETLRARLCEAAGTGRGNLASRTIIWPVDGGLELHPHIGWKAANLAEIGRIAGKPMAPSWFAVTDTAFRRILDAQASELLPAGAEFPGGAPTLRRAIGNVLARGEIDPLQKASVIRGLWESVVLPEDLTGEIVAAYRRLGQEASASAPGAASPTPRGATAAVSAGPDDGRLPLVALRSSSHEEDAETAARAGEFDTFLFIRGEKPLLEYLLRTWSGLWSERALHARAMLGASSSCSGGGVIVQRMVDSRVSGVLQTINVARNEFREIVINAGLGLGEGIVSGTVAADQITVSKEDDPGKGPLRFSYVTADKREYIVFNRRSGYGTMRSEAPYHQRLRPALEYPELCDLVGAAVRLESAYGYPLDIEFGIEGTKLWILQVRPVPAAFALLQETLRDHPLTDERALHPVQGEYSQ